MFAKMRHPLHAVGAPSLGGLPQWLPNRFSRDMPRHGCYKECAMLSHHVKTFQAEIWVASKFVRFTWNHLSNLSQIFTWNPSNIPRNDEVKRATKKNINILHRYWPKVDETLHNWLCVKLPALKSEQCPWISWALSGRLVCEIMSEWG